MDNDKKNREYFAEHVSDYDIQSRLRLDEEVLINRYFTPIQDKKLLVLGCGAGRVVPCLIDMGYKVTATDIEPKMIEATKKRLKELGDFSCTVMIADATKLPFANDSYDYILFPFHGIDCVFPGIFPVVDEAVRVGKNRSVFIFNSHNRLYLKKIHRFFKGERDMYGDLSLYRTNPWTTLRLRKYFKNVKRIERIALLPWSRSNWKDILYKFLPMLNKSTYFICTSPIKNKT
jgi:ubiquinone/menaquinone biosynthesis C-methylase UbiE